MTGLLQAFPPLDHEGDPFTVGRRWKQWIERFAVFLVAMNVKDEARKRAMLLYYVGETVHEIFKTLPDKGDDTDYERAVNCLDKYFKPTTNSEFPVFLFRKAVQNPDETIDQYQTRLRQLAQRCEFEDEDREIKSQIIQSCRSTKLRRRALKDASLTLEKLLDIERASEVTEHEVKNMENKESENMTANKLVRQKKKKQFQSQKQASSQKQRPELSHANKCRRCGGSYPHTDQCPAMGRECRLCHKMNHFAKECRSERNEKQSKSQTYRVPRKPSKQYARSGVNNMIAPRDEASPVETSHDSSSSDEYSYSVCADVNKAVKSPMPGPTAKLTVCNKSLKFLIDTGSSVTILDETSYYALMDRPALKKTNTRIFAYGQQPLKLLGTFSAVIESKKKLFAEKCYVTAGNCGNLLSYTAAKSLDLVSVKSANATNVTEPDSDSSGNVLKRFPKVTDGIGKLKGYKLKLHIDESVQPVAQPHRRMAFHQRDKISAELKRLQDCDIIEPVNGPTPWISPILAVPKPKDPSQVRLCLDARRLNEAIQRERHVTPTIHDLIHDLNGAKYFSKLDLRAGYHQIELDEQSRYITSFSTDSGLYRYKRLIFGICSASESFQNIISQVFADIEGVKNISDDIIVFGDTAEIHDQRLEKVMQRLKEKGLTLNADKCEFKKNKLEFMGLTFSNGGVSPSQEHLKALKKASAPNNVSELRSFLGMLTFSSRFIHNFATRTACLRELLKKNARWEWLPQHEAVFESLKASIRPESVLSYFDPRKETTVFVDASPVGLSAILVQSNSAESQCDYDVVSYASAALTPVQQRYSQIEREALACVWACEHYHLYLHGAKFTVVTDHKPLTYIFNNPSYKPTARIERFCMRLQPYEVTVKFMPGRENPSDFLSRHPLPGNKMNRRQERMAEEYINMMISRSGPDAITAEQVKMHTKNDKVLQRIITIMNNNSWKDISQSSDPELQAFYRVRNEMSLNSTGEILLRGTRLVLPKSLRKQAVDLAHAGHQGIVRTKQLIRESVWFPNVDLDVERAVRKCIPCQATTKTQQDPPVIPSVLPQGPWQSVSVDFLGPLPSGEYIMSCIDDYSRYPEIEIINSTASKIVCQKLEKIFSSFGVPSVAVRTDNGPPFNGSEFANFAKYMGFKHRKITPMWPRANGTVERLNQPLMKVIRAAHIENKNWRLELFKFLRSYRATPHPSTGKSPGELLFNRQLHYTLPVVLPTTPSDQDVAEKDKQMKSKGIKLQHKRPQSFRVGDHVLVKQKKKTKLTPFYDPRPYQLTHIKGTMLTATRHGHTITRNISHFKLLQYVDMDGMSDEEEDDSTPLMEEGENGENHENVQLNPENVQQQLQPDRKQYPQRMRRPPDYFVNN